MGVQKREDKTEGAATIVGRSGGGGGSGALGCCSADLLGGESPSSKSISITSTPFSSLLLTLEGWSSEEVMRFTPSIFLVLVKKEAQVRVLAWNEAVSGLGSSALASGVVSAGV